MTTNKKLDKTILEIIQGTRYGFLDCADMAYELCYDYDIIVSQKRIERRLRSLGKRGKINVCFTSISDKIN